LFSSKVEQIWILQYTLRGPKNVFCEAKMMQLFIFKPRTIAPLRQYICAPMPPTSNYVPYISILLYTTLFPSSFSYFRLSPSPYKHLHHHLLIPTPSPSSLPSLSPLPFLSPLYISVSHANFKRGSVPNCSAHRQLIPKLPINIAVACGNGHTTKKRRRQKLKNKET